jgi:protocatechuate 3,4-dioxygenase beta subunit
MPDDRALATGPDFHYATTIVFAWRGLAMEFDRRKFVGGAGAMLGAIGLAGAVDAQQGHDGRRPITRAEWDRIVRGAGSDGFTCVQATPMDEGPFYYESSPERRALAEGRPGEPLRLIIALGGVPVDGRGGCLPLHGAVVDIWHTDATGLYSNVGADLQPVDTTAQTFMRGHQRTDDKGQVVFDTIVPGWEIVAAAAPLMVARRTTHIHVKAYHGRDVMTTQLFLPDALLDALYADTEPYKSHAMLTAPGLDRAYGRIRNKDDLFFNTSRATPMTVERVNGVLTARATIGVISGGNRNIPTLFR